MAVTGMYFSSGECIYSGDETGHNEILTFQVKFDLEGQGGRRFPPWRHQAITWTNVDWSSVKSSDINIRTISQEMPQPSITKMCLTHWGWVTYICIGKITIIGSDNGLPPEQRQAII